MTVTDEEQSQEAVEQRKRLPKPALIAAAGAGVLVLAGVYAAGWSPVMGVNTIEIRGADTLAAEDLVSSAQITKGTPMMRVDLRAAEARISDLPQVSSVDVRRVWPRTVVITVTERGAVATQRQGKSWELLDANGSPFAVAPERPKDLPIVKPAPDPATTTAMLQVLAQMVPEVRAKVAEISADSPQSIRLRLRRTDAVVNWGSADDSLFKSQVLNILLSQKAGWYDVSSPENPTTAEAPPAPLPTASSSPLPDPAGSPSPEASPSETATPTPTPAVAESAIGVVPDA